MLWAIPFQPFVQEKCVWTDEQHRVEAVESKDKKSKLLAQPFPLTKMAVELEEGAFVCEQADIRGNVKIGIRSIVHPKAVIDAANGGPIVMGEGNIIEELVQIKNTFVLVAIEQLVVNEQCSSSEPMYIGNNNYFKTGCSASL